MSFCDRLNAGGHAPSGWKFTLPTETRWEYAATGGKNSPEYKYSGSNDIGAAAWYNGNLGGVATHPVGMKDANELGFRDMSGNVWEWCLDDWQDDSSKTVPEFSRGNDVGGPPRVCRGGGWRDSARLCRSANRFSASPGFSDYDLGFRVALVPVQ